jgi:hypothetical protein
VVVTIERVTGGEVTGDGGKKNKKPICKFVGKEKKLALNVTNCKTIAALYGNDTNDWAGKRIALYPTTTNAKSGETVECIRVRPREPAAPRPSPNKFPEATENPAASTAERQPGEDD